MAGSTETSRVNFNPDWMGPSSNSQGPAKFSSSCAQQAADGKMNSSSRDATNLDTILAPPKLSKNRYGREELLALFSAGVVGTAPPRLKDDFPDFHVVNAQDPICMLPYTEVEQNLLMQGGINSSKVINVVNHPERQQNQRWYQPQSGGGPVVGIGGGVGAGSPVSSSFNVGGGGGVIGGQGGVGGPGGNQPMFGGSGGFQKGFGRGGGGSGVDRGGLGDRDQSGGSYGRSRGIVPPQGDGGGNRFMGIGVGRGRGDFRSTVNIRPVGGGAPAAEKEMPSQNTRAQGLYDPNNPRDRPRQRLKSTGRSEDADGTNQQQAGNNKDDAENAADRSQQNTSNNSNNNNGNGGSRGATNYANFAGQGNKARHSSTGDAIGPSGPLPEWAKDDDPESPPTTAAGSFDATGNFRPANPNAPQRFSPTDLLNNDELKSKLSAKILEPIPSYDQQREKILAGPKPTATIMERNNLDSDGPLTPASRLQQQQMSNNLRRTPQTFGKTASFDSPVAENFHTPPSEMKSSSTAASVMLQNPMQSSSCSGTVGIEFLSSTTNVSATGLSQVMASSGSAFPVPSAVDKNVFLRGPQPPNSGSASFIQNQLSRTAPTNLAGQKMAAAPVSRQRQKIPATDDDLVLSNLHKQAENLVKSVFLDDQEQQQQRVSNSQSTLTVINSPDNNMWYYKDPSGLCQGPFPTEVMSVWFGHGYFTMSLMVRRANESNFIPLGDLIKQCGHIPFVTSTAAQPPNSALNLHNLTTSPTQPSSYIPYQQQQQQQKQDVNKPQQQNFGPMGRGGGSGLFASRQNLSSPTGNKQSQPGDLMASAANLNSMNFNMNSNLNMSGGGLNNLNAAAAAASNLMNNPNLTGLLQQQQQNQALPLMPNQQQQQYLSSYLMPSQQQQPLNPNNISLPNNFGDNYGGASTMTNNLTGAFTSRPLDPTGQNNKPNIWDVYNQNTNAINNPPPQLQRLAQSEITQQQQLNQQMDQKSLQTLIERLKEEEIKRQIEEEKKLIEKHEEELKQKLQAEQAKLQELQEQLKREKEEQDRKFRESEEQTRRQHEEILRQKKWLDEKRRCERIEEEEKRKKSQKSAWGAVSAGGGGLWDEEPDQTAFKKIQSKTKAKLEVVEQERKKKEEELEELRFYEEIRQKEEQEEKQRAAAEAKEKREQEKARKKEEQKKREQEEERLRKLQDVKDKENRELQRLEEENRRLQVQEREKALRRHQAAQEKTAALLAWSQIQQKSAQAQSLREIQMEEERQMAAERRQVLEQELIGKKDEPKALNSSPHYGAWGSTNSAAAKSLSWDKPVPETKPTQVTASAAAVASATAPVKMAPWVASSGAASLNTTQSSESGPDCAEGFWDEDCGAFGSLKVTKKSSVPEGKKKPVKGNQPSQQVNTKTKNQPKSNNNSNNASKTATPSSVSSDAVKRLFSAATPTDEFTVWCVKQVKKLNKEIDESEAAVLIEYLKDVPDFDVMDYVLGYIPDTQASKDFLKQYIERRAQHKRSSASSATVNEWSTVKSPSSSSNNNNSVGVANNSEQGGNIKKNKKKMTKRPVDNSILGFRAISDSSRVNVGEIDSPML